MRYIFCQNKRGYIIHLLKKCIKDNLLTKLTILYKMQWQQFKDQSLYIISFGIPLASVSQLEVYYKLNPDKYRNYTLWRSKSLLYVKSIVKVLYIGAKLYHCLFLAS